MTDQTKASGKDPLIHFPFFINQYQGLFSKFSFAEKGAFISLLCAFLSEDGELPEDPTKLARITGAFSNEERAALVIIKDEVVKLGKDILQNQKILREKRRNKASKGASKRWKKDATSIAPSIHQASFKQCLSDAITETETETETEIKKEKELLKKNFSEIYLLFHPDKKIKIIPFDRNKTRFQECLKNITLEELRVNVIEYLAYLEIASWRKKKEFGAWINSSESYANDWKFEKINEERKINPTSPTSGSYLDFISPKKG